MGVHFLHRARGAFARRRNFLAIAVALALVFGLSGLLLLSVSADDKRLTVYSNVASYSVGVVDRNGQEYVSVLDAIEPLGSVSANAIGSHWRMRYNNSEADFRMGSTSVRVRNSDLDLHAPFLLENGRGFVPLAALGNLMSKILGGPVTLHQDARRIFVGSVAIHFTAQIDKASPPKLVMNFTAPVNPMIATEPGKLLMSFNRDPVVSPGSPALTFDSETIPSATFDETNGTAQITVSATAPLFASFSDGNRTITISAAATSAKTQSGSTAQPAGAQAPQATTAPAASVPIPAPLAVASPAVSYFAVVDASHGGNDRGEDLPDHLEEKDLTLSFGRILRQELQSRGASTMLIRDGADGLSLDQRASATNFVHPVIYICLHVSSQGNGVRLYTSLLPEGGDNVGTFFDWNTAQAAFLPLSLKAASGIAGELERKQIPVRSLMAPLRPLNNIATTAVAVELAPLSASTGVNNTSYQTSIAASLATAVLSVRAQLEAGR
jgi:N-acetylmuramoyl-L-alanine amidase